LAAQAHVFAGRLMFQSLLRRLRLRQILAPPALEKDSKYYQLYMHRCKVPLAAMRLRRVGLSVAWRRRRLFKPLLRRLRLRHIVASPALEEKSIHYQLHLHRGKIPLAAMHLEDLVTCPKLRGEDACLSRCCAAFACGKLFRRLRLRQKASAWPPASTPHY
jgi:hypothetical protein